MQDSPFRVKPATKPLFRVLPLHGYLPTSLPIRMPCRASVARLTGNLKGIEEGEGKRWEFGGRLFGRFNVGVARGGGGSRGGGRDDFAGAVKTRTKSKRTRSLIRASLYSRTV